MAFIKAAEWRKRERDKQLREKLVRLAWYKTMRGKTPVPAMLKGMANLGSLVGHVTLAEVLT